MECISSWSLLMMLIYWVKTLNTIKKNMEAVLGTGKEVGLEVTQRKPSIWLCPVTRMRYIIY
jgi:hypothetical protein